MDNQTLLLGQAAAKFSNDYDLGEYLNEKYMNSLNSTELSELIKNNPNYSDLGKAARLITNNKLNS